jgi:hypothetical protein
VAVLLDDVIGETDAFLVGEADRMETARAREVYLAEGGRQAREISMRRQAVPSEDEIVGGVEEIPDSDDVADTDEHRSAASVPVGNVNSTLLRCQILGGAIHGDFIIVRTFARNAQQNRDREA